MAVIIEATPGDIPVIQEIAEKTWWTTYAPILPKDQLSYMLSLIYSKEALEKAILDKDQTFLLLKDIQVEGFASFSTGGKSTVAKLHKLYILPQLQGKGYGRLLLDEIKQRLADRGIRMVDLNVYRPNPARTFYEKYGFKIIGEENGAIGPYHLNDYVMRLEF